MKNRGILPSSSLVALLLSGCSTLATFPAQDESVSFSCEDNCTVSRMFSGTSMNFCMLNRNAEGTGIVIFDIPFSLAVDTIVLPITIYTQLTYGNICDKEIDPDSQLKATPDT